MILTCSFTKVLPSNPWLTHIYDVAPQVKVKSPLTVEEEGLPISSKTEKTGHYPCCLCLMADCQQLQRDWCLSNEKVSIIGTMWYHRDIVASSQPWRHMNEPGSCSLSFCRSFVSAAHVSKGWGVLGRHTGLPALQPLPCLLRSCLGREGHEGHVYQYNWSIGFPVPLSCSSLMAFKLS